MEHVQESSGDMPVPHRPLSLWEIIGSGFRLSGRTLRRGGLLAIVVVVPLFLIFGQVARGFLLDGSRIMANAARRGTDMTSDDLAAALTTLFGGSTMLSVAFMFLLSGLVLAQVAITVDSWDAALVEERPFQQWIRRSFGRPFWSGLVQLVVIIALFILVTIASVLLEASLGSAVGTGGSSAVGVFYVGAALFFLVGTVLRVHEIVADDRGPWHSIVSSIALVRGRWLKTFAIIALLFIVFQLLSTAISVIVLPGMRVELPAGATAMDARVLSKAWSTAARVMTPGYLMASAVLLWLMLHLSTNILTALYVDLRARRGDFDLDVADTSWDHGVPEKEG